ncbi:hypothetical protein EVAR_45612_1 [Eumeta japonica]|uniref:Uncharacterized protein n=1 Tax=Eumeta variegata TaxID=151549 RepID=A0A4C1WDV2_EUMVA|nr:hypothetical protein EVAR_45612_1 [Eumeta japonica]
MENSFHRRKMHSLAALEKRLKRLVLEPSAHNVLGGRQFIDVLRDAGTFSTVKHHFVENYGRTNGHDSRARFIRFDEKQKKKELPYRGECRVAVRCLH